MMNSTEELAEKTTTYKQELKGFFVFSGNVNLGKVGEPTEKTDSFGKPLFVGDIVMSSNKNAEGVYCNHGLSVVVSAEFSNKGLAPENHSAGHFVMGIKNIDFMGKDADEWFVTKLKSHKDIVVGEHWKDYGFNYRLI